MVVTIDRGEAGDGVGLDSLVHLDQMSQLSDPRVIPTFAGWAISLADL